MLFNTMQYFIFLPTVVCIYYCLPPKVRYIWLLITSYYFYMQWNPLYITLLFSCTFLTYLCGRVMEKTGNKEADREEPVQAEEIWKRRVCLVICIFLNLGILGFFKYFQFGISVLNRLLAMIHVSGVSWEHDILLPVGISFYTLQALGYLLDVYRGDIHAEKNFLRYALFVSFFPQLVAGPIERSKNLLVQLRHPQAFSYENLRKGALLVLYGLFLKMVIADRAAVIVDTVYQDRAAYPGVYVAVATVFFSIQIYCDFYGYSTIARGSALIMGIHLMDNFNAPYYSRSVKEFWRRWHISLSGWFRDYLYIPLGGNRRGLLRKQENLLAVFAVSGLWHGASFAWLFFRAGELDVALEMLQSMVCKNNWTILFDGSLYGLGVEKHYMNVLLGSILLLFVVDYHKYHGEDMADVFLKQGWWFRVSGIMLLLFTILLYGCYGEMYDVQQFIYFQF